MGRRMMLAANDIINNFKAQSDEREEVALFNAMLRDGVDPNNKCIYIPGKDYMWMGTEERTRIRTIFPRYKPFIGFYSRYKPDEGDDYLVVDLSGCYEKHFSYWALNGKMVSDKVSLALYGETGQLKVGQDKFVGRPGERIQVECTLAKVCRVECNNDFGDFVNILFACKNDGESTILEWIQRNYSENTVKAFSIGKNGKKRKLTLVGTVYNTFTRFGKSYTRVKRCDVYDESGCRLCDFARRRRVKGQGDSDRGED